MQLILRASRVEVGCSHHCAHSIEQYFSPSGSAVFLAEYSAVFLGCNGFALVVGLCEYLRGAGAGNSAKYSPYSNDTLTDRRREGEIIGGLMKAKYGPFVQSSEQQRSHEPPNGKRHLPGSSQASKQCRESNQENI